MRIMKVFDCQDMPNKLREMFFDRVEKGNDVYINWCIHETTDPSPEDIAIDNWLILQGANPGTENDCGEEVLIKHWW